MSFFQNSQMWARVQLLLTSELHILESSSIDSPKKKLKQINHHRLKLICFKYQPPRDTKWNVHRFGSWCKPENFKFNPLQYQYIYTWGFQNVSWVGSGIVKSKIGEFDNMIFEAGSKTINQYYQRKWGTPFPFHSYHLRYFGFDYRNVMV